MWRTHWIIEYVVANLSIDLWPNPDIKTNFNPFISGLFQKFCKHTWFHTNMYLFKKLNLSPIARTVHCKIDREEACLYQIDSLLWIFEGFSNARSKHKIYKKKFFKKMHTISRYRGCVIKKNSAFVFFFLLKLFISKKISLTKIFFWLERLINFQGKKSIFYEAKKNLISTYFRDLKKIFFFSKSLHPSPLRSQGTWTCCRQTSTQTDRHRNL